MSGNVLFKNTSPPKREHHLHVNQRFGVSAHLLGAHYPVEPSSSSEMD